MGETKNQWFCHYCGNRLYRLGDGRVKCSNCKRRYSFQRAERNVRLVQCFCRDLTAMDATRECGITYTTAKNFYDRLRRLLPPLLEAEYEANRHRIVEYDEYLYLDHSKRNDKRHIFDAHDMLTFDYGGRVYSVLMPPLNRYKQAFLDDRLENLYYQEFSRFLNLHRITRLKSRDNTIVRFWRFLDEFMKHYRGVSRENFFYYLKEAEFKFNYPMPKREEALIRIFFENGG